MSAAITEQTVNMLEVVKEEEIAAPIDVVFETILEEMGPRNEREVGEPMPMKLEAWPGGRWYRDLGNGAGHWWGTVQSIKAPSLLEIHGPLFMSYPASSNVQYRLKEENGVTKLRFTHRAMAWISYDPEIREQWSHVQEGWGSLIDRIANASVRK
jgi:Activator of Hsp90 ATPase homolog 1-like protein